MKKTRITCDTEVPISTINGNKFNHYSGTTYHNYSLPHGRIVIATNANDNDKQYDKPQRKNAINDKAMIDSNLSMEITGSSQGTRTTIAHCIHNNELSNKCHTRIRNYDIPKDTINSNILESKCQQPIQSMKQSLLHGQHHHHSESRKTSIRQPPPTIVLTPPDDASSEKVKVIFECDNEKFIIQPNFLIRYKRIILSVVVLLLIILLLISTILVIYIAHRKR